MSEWHIIACEYPPQIGGVSSYVESVARGLGAAGQRVHVWCPPARGPRPQPTGVAVHEELGQFTPSDLRRVSRQLDRFAGPRRVLIQWVPHGYGYRSMNLPFCLWARRRARRGDCVDIMVHEPFLAFEGSWKQRAAAAVHRVMTFVLLGAARRAWISIPSWRGSLEPFAAGRPLGFDWLPVPSPVEPIEDPRGVAAARSRYARENGHLVGHFGLYSRLIAKPMKEVVAHLLGRTEAVDVLLMGEGSSTLRRDIIEADPNLASRVHASGPLSRDELSRHLQACDVLMQPYPEGISSRRTSTMAALAHGKAIVTTDGPASEPIWRERRAVSLTVFEPALIAAEVERLVTNERARRELGDCARRAYEERFAVKHTVDGLIAS
jgi:glycosyltransferase involved in cell wall biosynthesis